MMEAYNNRSTTGAISSVKLVEGGSTCLAKTTFYNDATKAWNSAPESIKACKTIWSAKNKIKKFVKTLPI